MIASDYGLTLTEPAFGPENGPCPVSAEAANTVRYLHGRGHGWVLASDVSPKSADRRAGLAAAGVLDCFTAVITSDDVGVKKPDARFYRAVISAAGCAPEEILFIGNRLAKDVYGPIVHGMCAALVNTSGEGDGAPPWIPVLDSVAELPSLLRRWGVEP